MKKLVGLLCVISPVFLFSQNKDSLDMKNEIGVNIIPTVKALNVSSAKNYYDNSFFYKHRIAQKIWLRINAGVAINHSYDGPSVPTIKNVDNNFVSVNYWEKHTRPLYHMEAGAEYRWGKHRIKYFTGIDFGYAQVQYNLVNYYGLREKSLPIAVSFFGFGDGYKNQDSILYSVRINEKRLSFLPFFGIQTKFTRRLSFVIQFGLPYTCYATTLMTVSRIRPENFNNSKYFGIEFERFLNSLSLCFSL